MNKTHQINVRMTPEDVAGLLEIEKHTGSTRSEILRKWLRMGIAKDLRAIEEFLGQSPMVAMEDPPAKKKKAPQRKKAKS